VQGSIALPPADQSGDDTNFFRNRIRQIYDERALALERLHAVSQHLSEAYKSRDAEDERVMAEAKEQGLTNLGIPIGECQFAFLFAAVVVVVHRFSICSRMITQRHEYMS
jgi:hypothetical protein